MMDLLNIDSIQNLYLLKNLNALYESVSLNLFQLTRNYLIGCINNNFLILFFRVPHMKHVWSTDRFLQTSSQEEIEIQLFLHIVKPENVKFFDDKKIIKNAKIKKISFL